MLVDDLDDLLKLLFRYHSGPLFQAVEIGF